MLSRVVGQTHAKHLRHSKGGPAGRTFTRGDIDVASGGWFYQGIEVDRFKHNKVAPDGLIRALAFCVAAVDTGLALIATVASGGPVNDPLSQPLSMGASGRN